MRLAYVTVGIRVLVINWLLLVNEEKYVEERVLEGCCMRKASFAIATATLPKPLAEIINEREPES